MTVSWLKSFSFLCRFSALGCKWTSWMYSICLALPNNAAWITSHRLNFHKLEQKHRRDSLSLTTCQQPKGVSCFSFLEKKNPLNVFTPDSQLDSWYIKSHITFFSCFWRHCPLFANYFLLQYVAIATIALLTLENVTPNVLPKLLSAVAFKCLVSTGRLNSSIISISL